MAVAVLSAAFAGLVRAGRGGRGAAPNQAPSPLRIGARQEPDSLNPFIGVLTQSCVIWAQVYELLVAIGPDLQPYPSLAYDWEVDAAGLNWTFDLLDNATWHDGVPFTAEDVNFTFRYIAPQSPGNPIGCDQTLLQGYLGGVDIDDITVINSTAIRIPTLEPKANILSMFIQILPQHIWDTGRCNQAGNKNIPPIGTGMYKFTSWVRGNYIQLDLNTAYWRLTPGRDYVDTIIISFYRDSTSLYNAFLAGDLQATGAPSSRRRGGGGGPPPPPPHAVLALLPRRGGGIRLRSRTGQGPPGRPRGRRIHPESRADRARELRGEPRPRGRQQPGCVHRHERPVRWRPRRRGRHTGHRGGPVGDERPEQQRASVHALPPELRHGGPGRRGSRDRLVGRRRDRGHEEHRHGVTDDHDHVRLLRGPVRLGLGRRRGPGLPSERHDDEPDPILAGRVVLRSPVRPVVPGPAGRGERDPPAGDHPRHAEEALHVVD